ncbi:MAG: sulfotransferase family protein [Anaerolineae bacterium]
MTAPVFVVGSDRSGTTLLRLMLTCHPTIAIPPESLFALELYPAWGEVRLEQAAQIHALCDDLYEDAMFREWQVDRETLEQAIIDRLPSNYADFVNLVYLTYAQQVQPSATRWGDKNPRYTMHLTWIWRLFPGAQVIHIIRDGRAVFGSFRDTNRKAGRIIWPQTVSAAARSWTIRLTKARQHRANTNYTEVFYEKLVESPETELRRLCDFLDLEYDPGMLDFADANRREELVPKRQLVWHDATLGPVQDSRVAAWQQSLSPSDIARFELMAGHHLISCGYPLQASRLGRFGAVNTVVLYAATALRKFFGMQV